MNSNLWIVVWIISLLIGWFTRDIVAWTHKSIERLHGTVPPEKRTECDFCDDQALYRQCQRCMNDKLIGSHTDEEWRELKSENAELKKFLKHARDDKEIRLGEIGVLEERNENLRGMVAHLQGQCDKLRNKERTE